MSETQNKPLLKKRGRKPKNMINNNVKQSAPIDSDKEQIIVHLPISIDDILTNNNVEIDDSINIFIKNDKDFKTYDTNEESKKNIIATPNNITETKQPEKSIQSINNPISYKNINQINVYNVNFNVKSKCLWCKHSFDTPALQLPEDYYNDTFYCIGNFCSWNCMKSYNIDINDSMTWKRESLIHLMYYKTYGELKDIDNAPSWLLLEDFGGILTIEKFRELFIMNTSDYTVLHPPLITRQLQIEESYKKSNNNITNSSFESELVLKRSKPIETTITNLEKAMNLRKTKKVLI
jgi:hypothetical protein